MKRYRVSDILNPKAARLLVGMLADWPAPRDEKPEASKKQEYSTTPAPVPTMQFSTEQVAFFRDARGAPLPYWVRGEAEGFSFSRGIETHRGLYDAETDYERPRDRAPWRKLSMSYQQKRRKYE